MPDGISFDSSAFMACARLLDLHRPLAFLDLETTGTDVKNDRIIEVGIVVLHPNGSNTPFSTYVHPGCPIPADVQALTGIRAEMVIGAPDFELVAPVLNKYLANADLAGYNIQQFDYPFLQNEFTRCGKTLAGPSDRHVVDAYQIFRQFEPHTLERAVAYYTGQSVIQAHRAIDDVQATARVLSVQLSRYHLLGTVDEVERKSRFPYLDAERKIREENGQAVFCFGKYKSRRVAEVHAENPAYILWVIETMGGDTARVLQLLLAQLERSMVREPELPFNGVLVPSIVD